MSRLGAAGCACLRAAATIALPRRRPAAALYLVQQRRLLHAPTAGAMRPALGRLRMASVIPFTLSDIGEGIAEVQIKEWHVSPGARVAQFDDLCEVQSDKASVTITSRYDGVVRKLHYEVDDMAKVGSVLVDIEVEEGDGAADEATPAEEEPSAPAAAHIPAAAAGAPPAFQPPPTVVTTPPTPSPPAGGRARAIATPAVRRIAMEHKITLTDVRGTGKEGRVLKGDILRHVGALPPVDGDVQRPPVTAAAVDAHAPRVQTFEPLAEDTVVPIRGYTRAMFKSMTAANAIPHFGYRDEVCVDRLVDLREQLKAMESERQVKMSFMPLFIKAASMALHHFPVLNASVDERQENVIYKSSHNICVAMDTAGGLVVPNIKHCERRNLWDIAAELIRLRNAAGEMRVAQADLEGGTFTLSNIGSIGGTYAHPMIFPPQVAIGALGRIMTQARWCDSSGAFRPTKVVKVSWCADHRVVDGATMARYSNAWKGYLEHPATMIAELR